jgi:asparagine synthase (glutamine-hydrolysing)
MAASLETRVPFLSPTMSEWALGLSPDAIGPPGAKALPRALASRVLPGDLASRPKQGFSVPLAQWLRGPLAGTLEEALAPSELKARGTFDPEAVRLLLARLHAGRQGVAGALWAVLIYQRWLLHQ